MKTASEKLDVTASTFISGADLTADCTAPEHQLFWCWLGAIPDCPIRNPTIGGLCWYQFNVLARKIEEHRMSMAHGTPTMGHVYKLSREKLRHLADCVKRSVLRFLLDQSGEVRMHGTGAPMVMPVRIHKPEEIELLRRHDRPITPYVGQAGDKPMAEYLYLQILHEKSPHLRGVDAVMPPPLSVTGFEIPGPDAVPIGKDERLHPPPSHTDGRVTAPFEGWTRPESKE